jgi:hypothetical protein
VFARCVRKDKVHEGFRFYLFRGRTGEVRSGR